MNKQKVFTKVVNHLLSMKKQSTNDTGRCVYRAADGSKCAIGCLITDKEYSSRMEFKSVNSIAEMLPKRLLGDIGFLMGLQSIHDYSLHWNTKGISKRVLRGFAKKRGLQYPS